MSVQRAVLIGMDSYFDPSWKPLSYAEAAVQDLKTHLTQLGLTGKDILSITGATATRAVVESRLRRFANSLTAADSLLVFITGRMLVQDGQTYLVCTDTLKDDLPVTALSFQDLWHIVTATGSALYLCVDGQKEEDHPWYDAEEWHDLLTDSGHVAFLAAQPQETSAIAESLKQSIWTYHLLRAFSGEDEEALANDQLTVTTLKKYLEKQVPRTIRKELISRKKQTPMFLGGLSKESLADLGPIRSAKETTTLSDQELKRIVFRSEVYGKIKHLMGYQKGHHLPEKVNAAAEKFVARIALPDITADMEETLNALREAMDWKRKDLSSSAQDGMGAIQTPAFDYALTIQIDPGDPTRFVRRREITQLEDLNIIRHPGFQRVFGTSLDTLIFEFEKPMDLNTWLDAWEENPLEGAKVRMSVDDSACEITLQGFAGSIRLEKQTLTILGRSMTASGLIDQFLRFFQHMHQPLAISFKM